MKYNLLAIGILGMLTACGPKTTNEYTVTAPVSADDMGKTVYLTNYMDREKVDSVVVDNDSVVVFQGIVEAPYIAAITMENKGRTIFVLEPGVITIDGEGNVEGGTLNAKFADYNDQFNAIVKDLRATEDDSVKEVLKDKYYALMDTAVAKESDNPIGAMYFAQTIYNYDLAGLDSVLAVYPQYNIKKVQDYHETLVKKEATSAGKKFVDFEIEGEKGGKLSDYAGKGKYLLVDFWASWCGPCRGEIPNLKEVYKKHKGDKFEILGVAVWDKPEDTEKAAQELGIEWPEIQNAQAIPTDLYGISGIPHIMLIDPEGIIVERDLRGEHLAAVVDSVMNLK